MLVEEARAARRPARLAAADAVLSAGWLAVIEWLTPRLPPDAADAVMQIEARFALDAAYVRAALDGA